jgi:hypothetical protein
MEASIVSSNSLLLTRFTRWYTGQGVNRRLLRRAWGQGLGHDREKRVAAGRAAESKNPLQVRKRGGEHLRACPSKIVNFISGCWGLGGVEETDGLWTLLAELLEHRLWWSDQALGWAQLLRIRAYLKYKKYKLYFYIYIYIHTII